MPCRTDDTYINTDARHYPSGVSDAKYNALKKEADNVTRLLCSVMRVIEKSDYAIAKVERLSSIDGLKDWWEEHQEIDRKRIEKEVKDAAEMLKDLSPEARELLARELQK